MIEYIHGPDYSKWELMYWDAASRSYKMIPGVDLHLALQDPRTRFSITRFSVAYWDSVTGVVVDPSVNYVLDVVKEYPDLPFTGYMYWSPMANRQLQRTTFLYVWNMMKMTLSAKHKIMRPIVDAEYHANMPRQTVAALFEQMLLDVESDTGVMPMIYSGAGFMNWLYGTIPARLLKYEWHIASYKSLIYRPPTLPKGLPERVTKLWQHSATARYPGLDGGVDDNVFMWTEQQWADYVGNVSPQNEGWIGEVKYNGTRVRTTPAIASPENIVTQLNYPQRVRILQDNIPGLDNSFRWGRLGGDYENLYICIYSDKELVRKVS